MSEEEKKSSNIKNGETFLEWISSPQMLVSLSAVLLSVCGLFIAIYETSLMREQQEIMREQQYASVWPHLTLGHSFNLDEQWLEIGLNNSGVGPAEVKAAFLLHDGKVVANWRALIEKFSGKNNYITGKRRLISGSVISPSQNGSYIYRLEPETDTEKQLFRKMIEEIYNGNFNIKVCYCSVYNDCWTTEMQQSLKRLRGEKVPSREERKVNSCKDFSVSGI